MVQENVRFNNSNFCITPILGTYGSIDTSNIDSFLYIKNTSGTLIDSFSFNTNFKQHTTFISLDYIGPRDTTVYVDNMLFLTSQYLYTTISGYYTEVTFWQLEVSTSTLVKYYSLVKSYSDSSYIFNTQSFTPEVYYTHLSSSTVSGTGYINIADTSNITSTSYLYLGLSSNVNNLNALEKVEVSSVSGTLVYLKNKQAPFNYYNINDSVVIFNDLYLQSAEYNELNKDKGILYKLDKSSGAVLTFFKSGLFKDVEALSFSSYYISFLCIVKKSQLLYYDLIKKEVQRSYILNTVDAYGNYLVIDDIALYKDEVVRLQKYYMARSEIDGSLGIKPWSYYNIISDTMLPYVNTITLYVDGPSFMCNNTTITLKALVLDQYNVGVSNKEVTFSRTGDQGGTFSDPDGKVLTDIDGWCLINYTSGWYDTTKDVIYDQVVTFYASTDGGNINLGTDLVKGTFSIKLQPSFIAGAESSPHGYEIITFKPLDFFGYFKVNYYKEYISYLNLLYLDYLFKSNVFCLQLTEKSSAIFCTMLSDSVHTSPINFLSEFSDDTSLFYNYLSRHLPIGSNEVTSTIAQFSFIQAIKPVPYSDGNALNSEIWLRLSPYGYSLDKTSLIFKVREVSYIGDTGYILLEESSFFKVTEFNVGVGLKGLEISFKNPNKYHYNALVYVYLEVYDTAPEPNLFRLDYWFSLIEDYILPYICNIEPLPNSTYALIENSITFDIIDKGTGINLDTLILKINNRFSNYSYTTISGGYTIYSDLHSYNFSDKVSVYVEVFDNSVKGNKLKKSWVFYTKISEQPILDTDSILLPICADVIPTRLTYLTFNIFSKYDGIDPDQCIFVLDNTKVDVEFRPIMKRLS